MTISNRAEIPDVKVFSLDRFSDERGYVTETFSESAFSSLLNPQVPIISVHETFSKKNVLRGLHYQIDRPQSRLIRVSYGMIYEVAVDLRKSSPTFGKWRSETLSADYFSTMWVPSGVAHGYLVLSDFAIVSIFTDQTWNADRQRFIRWDDKTLSIDWPLFREYPILVPPITSERDKKSSSFLDAEHFNG